jgi:hypothetical protein
VRGQPVGPVVGPVPGMAAGDGEKAGEAEPGVGREDQPGRAVRGGWAMQPGRQPSGRAGRRAGVLPRQHDRRGDVQDKIAGRRGWDRLGWASLASGSRLSRKERLFAQTWTRAARGTDISRPSASFFRLPI